MPPVSKLHRSQVSSLLMDRSPKTAFKATGLRMRLSSLSSPWLSRISRLAPTSTIITVDSRSIVRRGTLSATAKNGIIAGGALIFLAIILGCFLFFQKQKRKQQDIKRSGVTTTISRQDTLGPVDRRVDYTRRRELEVFQAGGTTNLQSNKKGTRLALDTPVLSDRRDSNNNTKEMGMRDEIWRNKSQPPLPLPRRRSWSELIDVRARNENHENHKKKATISPEASGTTISTARMLYPPETSSHSGNQKKRPSNALVAPCPVKGKDTSRSNRNDPTNPTSNKPIIQMTRKSSIQPRPAARSYHSTSARARAHNPTALPSPCPKEQASIENAGVARTPNTDMTSWFSSTDIDKSPDEMIDLSSMMATRATSVSNGEEEEVDSETRQPQLSPPILSSGDRITMGGVDGEREGEREKKKKGSVRAARDRLRNGRVEDGRDLSLDGGTWSPPWSQPPNAKVECRGHEHDHDHDHEHERDKQHNHHPIPDPQPNTLFPPFISKSPPALSNPPNPNTPNPQNHLTLTKPNTPGPTSPTSHRLNKAFLQAAVQRRYAELRARGLSPVEVEGRMRGAGDVLGTRGVGQGLEGLDLGLEER
ncbi:hypothetical protein MMC09_003005 [Bachmanniomyces sp. S44760]|nr:hypothetical protein [Bachmanniomyces sp. S44760]